MNKPLALMVEADYAIIKPISFAQLLSLAARLRTQF